MFRAWGAVAVAIVAGCPAQARAESHDATTIVLVTTPDASATEQETIDAIRAQVGDLSSLHLVVERHERARDMRAQLDVAAQLRDAHQARGVFWLDVDAPGDALLYLLDADGKRLLVRRVRRDPTTPDTAAVTEEVANVARANLAALAEGREIGMVPVALPAPPPEPPPRPPAPERPRRSVVRPAPRTWMLGVDVAYVGSNWAAASPWESGVSVGIDLSHHSGVGGRATYTFFPSETFGGGATVAISLTRHPAELAATWDAHLGRYVYLGGEVGAVLDPITRATIQTAPGLAPSPDALDWTFAVSPKVRVAVRPWPSLRLFARAGADFFVVQNDFLVSGHPAFLSPNLVRARLDLGIDVIAW